MPSSTPTPDPHPDNSAAFVTKLKQDGSGLVYSTYLGGTGSAFGNAIAVDADGHAYVTGSTDSRNFPTTAGAFQTTNPDPGAFVTKLNRDGSALIYSTYLGSSSDGSGIAVDGDRHAYVTGATYKSQFPTTPGAFQQTNPDPKTFGHAFVTKLNRDGSALVYSTYLGGAGGGGTGGNGAGIAVDRDGHAYVTGSTISPRFPTTACAFQPTDPAPGPSDDGNTNTFVTKLSRDGSALVYSTYLGSSNTDFGKGIAVDGDGHAYVTGGTNASDFPTTAGSFQPADPAPELPDEGNTNAFVTKLNRDGSGLVYSTYLGGTTSGDEGTGIDVDRDGHAYVAGRTQSPNFPTTAGAFQPYSPAPPLPGGESFFHLFVTKLSRDGSALVYSTYLGGTDSDFGNGIAVDGEGHTHVIGVTSSHNFPTTFNAFQVMDPNPARGRDAGVVTKFNPDPPC